MEDINVYEAVHRNDTKEEVSQLIAQHVSQEYYWLLFSEGPFICWECTECIIVAQCRFQQYFSYFVTVMFIGG